MLNVAIHMTIKNFILKLCVGPVIVLLNKRQLKWIIFLEFYGKNSAGHFLHIIISRGFVGTVEVNNLLDEEKQ